MIRPSRLVLAAAGLLTALPVLANDDLKSLRDEIAQMKQAYEQPLSRWKPA